MFENTTIPLNQTVYDAVILGAGYAGFAAARTLVAAGHSVLLVDRRAAVLAESGWSFEARIGRTPETGSRGSESRAWRNWLGTLQSQGSATDERLSGACAEVIASQWLQCQRVSGAMDVLYYATPLAVESSARSHRPPLSAAPNVGQGDLVKTVLFATRAGLRTVSARRWLDCTDSGELLRLLVPGWSAPSPNFRQISLFFRASHWAGAAAAAFSCETGALQLGFEPGYWPHERCLTIKSGDAAAEPRSWWLPALRILREVLKQDVDDAVLTHGSVEPVAFYDGDAGSPAAVTVASNVLSASPWQVPNAEESRLAGRFALGARMAQKLLDAPASRPESGAPFEGGIETRPLATRIAVAGLGTGGAFAALAAGRESRRHGEESAVLGFDPLPFCGGIGSGGGIHHYYFGVKGGLQEELDAKTREISPLFGTRGQVKGFHPDAKKCVLESLLTEAGVSLAFGSTLVLVERQDRRVTGALLATAEGPVHLTASAWIDATGDGDLAARAGAGIRLGREGDGLPHAYSQSSGKFKWLEGRPYLEVVNFDAGYTDPTDAQDLTRARLAGISQYAQEHYTETESPTYIAPAIGLRQSRHIETDYVLELNDQIIRRRFPDAVGLAGCHFDNHAMDYELESAEGMFFTWACRGFQKVIGSQIPYRILLPASLDNVWLACRALGVTQDAHYSLRMQRDMQRVGEAAGLAAATAPDGLSRAVDLLQLQESLRASGALTTVDIQDDDFGRSTAVSDLARQHEVSVSSWLGSLQRGDEGLDIWHLYWAGKTDGALRDTVMDRLAAADRTVAWRSAALAAMWCEPRAEAGLLRRIAERHLPIPEGEKTDSPWLAPYWVASLALLPRVVTVAALPVLSELAGEEALPLNLRTTLALCAAALARQNQLTPDQRAEVEDMLACLLAVPAPNTLLPPQHPPLRIDYPEPQPTPTTRAAVREDMTWQIHLCVARARLALGLELQGEAERFLHDDRSLVRTAFEKAQAEDRLFTEVQFAER